MATAQQKFGKAARSLVDGFIAVRKDGRHNIVAVSKHAGGGFFDPKGPRTVSVTFTKFVKGADGLEAVPLTTTFIRSLQRISKEFNSPQETISSIEVRPLEENHHDLGFTITFKAPDNWLVKLREHFPESA